MATSQADFYAELVEVTREREEAYEHRNEPEGRERWDEAKRRYAEFRTFWREVVQAVGLGLEGSVVPPSVSGGVNVQGQEEN